jgi:hypothetical protein
MGGTHQECCWTGDANKLASIPWSLQLVISLLFMVFSANTSWVITTGYGCSCSASS